MNEFGRLAHDHWAQWLPTRFDQIADPDRFFTGLGIEVAQQIEATMDATTGPTDVPLEQLGAWWATAKMNATNQVLAEMVFVAPEEDLQDAERPLDPELSLIHI